MASRETREKPKKACGASKPRAPVRVTQVRPAGDQHQVVTVTGGRGLYRRKPCATCPWRVDATGTFPAEAFRHSAGTAYDMSTHTFACHESGTAKPAVCAGFLLRAHHNMAVRLGAINGKYALDEIEEGDAALFEDYRAMAIANGVDPDDPAIQPCR